MAAIRGRGYGRGTSESANAKALRRPVEAGLMQRLETLTSSITVTSDIKSEVLEVCEKMAKVDFNIKAELDPLTAKIRTLCVSVSDMEKSIESIFAFALKSKWNAHVAAIFCNAIGDITIEESKFRTLLLRQLQISYKERNKKYLELDSFLMNVTFLCEIYHHIRIESKYLKVLSRPITDYFGMLIDGASQKEVEVFLEQFPKCYFSLKENDQAGLDTIISKLRKQIICEPSNVVVRAMLLEIFESILRDFEPLSESATKQYESLSKPILRICE